MWIDIFGYSAMVLVAVSFLFSDIKWIRIVNLVGALCFVVYGVFLTEPPIIITNIIISCIQIYYLFIKKNKAIEKKGADIGN